MLKKYLSAYIFPIFKNANVNKIATVHKNTSVFTTIEICKNKIPTEITLAIKYNICLKDKYPPKNFLFMCEVKWYFVQTHCIYLLTSY